MSKQKKLILNKSTLRTLTTDEAGQVAGGAPTLGTILTCNIACLTKRTCY